MAVDWAREQVEHNPDSLAWGYGGPIGPERWATLSEAYAECGGEQQSPVDISGYEPGNLGPLSFSYDGEAAAVRNDGHAVHVDFEADNTLTSGDRTFELASLHMHAPSEHLVDGAQFVMREPRTISQEQVAALLALSGGPNNRPVQPIGGRAIRLGGAS